MKSQGRASKPTSFWRQAATWARWVCGILVGVICLWLSLRATRVQTVLAEIAGVQQMWVWLAGGGVILVSVLKALRWRWLYPRTAPDLTWTTHFNILMTTQMLNLLIPVRIGEIARLGLMRQEGRSVASTLGTIVVEKALDLMVAQALLVVTLLAAIAPDWLRTRAGLGMIVLGVAVPIGLLAAIRLRSVLARLVAQLPTPRQPLVARLAQRSARTLQAMLDSIAALNGPQVLRLVALTTGIWLLSLAVIQMMLAAFAVPVDWGAALLLMLALTFSNWAPTPPGMIGVVGAVTVVTLGPFGVAPGRALALGAVLNAVLIVPPIALGAWATWMRLWRLPTTTHTGRLTTALGINRRSDPFSEQPPKGPSA